MNIDTSLVALDQILGLRELYRQEMNCQIVHDSLHARGFTESYLLHVEGSVAGYGALVRDRAGWKDVIKEFYVVPAYRAVALRLFRHFAAASRAKSIEAQTNDLLLTLMLLDCANRVQSGAILFNDALTTHFSVPGCTFRSIAAADHARIFPHAVEPVGDWMIEGEGEVAATGGILCHYNPPYGDIFMEVAPRFRGRGYGSYLVQELKRTCYQMGRIPAARCHPENLASRATLEKAGLLPCARILSGVIAA